MYSVNFHFDIGFVCQSLPIKKGATSPGKVRMIRILLLLFVGKYATGEAHYYWLVLAIMGQHWSYGWNPGKRSYRSLGNRMPLIKQG